MHISIIARTSAILLSSCALLRAESAVPPAEAPAVVLKAGSEFAGRDTLSCGTDSIADACACLDGLKWEAGPFAVRCELAKPDRGDWLVRFPTAFPGGNAINDLVAMEWYMARDEKGSVMRAPAMVVVHESGRGMTAGRIFAKGLRQKGCHTFLIHLPGYGERTSPVSRDTRDMLPALRQGVADVRRARDAVAVLPFIDTSLIALQGTSLGGFVAATVSGLDRGYDKSFILLAGGQLAEVVLKGERDAAKMHRRLAEGGISDQQIRDSLQVIEPMRLAHRIDPARTWLFSGTFDEVVPPACSLAFAKAAKLTASHHSELPVGHYTAAVLLPVILQQISNIMHGLPMNPAAPEKAVTAPVPVESAPVVPPGASGK